MPRLENSAGPSHPRLYRLILYCLRCTLQPSATGNKLISKRYQHFREHGLPYGLHDSLCTLHLFCSTLNICLRHRCNTRYGWLARPYPTGSFTLQDAPSCAWRANARADRCAAVFCASLLTPMLCGFYVLRLKMMFDKQ